MESKAEPGPNSLPIENSRPASKGGWTSNRILAPLANLFARRDSSPEMAQTSSSCLDARLFAGSLAGIAIALIFLGIVIQKNNKELTNASLSLQKAAEKIKAISSQPSPVQPAPSYRQPTYMPRQAPIYEQRYMREVYPRAKVRSFRNRAAVKSRSEIVRYRDRDETRQGKLAKKSRKMKKNLLNDSRRNTANKRRNSKSSMSAKMINFED